MKNVEFVCTGFVSYELSILTKSVYASERFFVLFDLVDYFGDGSALDDFLGLSYDEQVNWALEQVQSDNSDLPNLLEIYIDSFHPAPCYR